MPHLKAARWPRLATWFIPLVLAALLGCGEHSTAPRPDANVYMRLSLAKTVLSPGDTIVATVQAVNEGTVSASLFYCGQYFSTSIENDNGRCLVGCIVACPADDSSPFELQPGGVLKQTFRFASLDWQGRPFPPGLYAVNAGLYAVNAGLPALGAARVRARFVINEP